MNEIEKMYENAGVEKSPTIARCVRSWGGGFCVITEKMCKKKNKAKCKNFKGDLKEGEYPPFTAEKQIAILNFCLKWGQVHLLRGIDDEYRIENCCYRQGYQPTIADAIANYINEKWEKLTLEERKQIKEILK